MKNNTKVSILNFDLSDNSLGRAYIIAKALQKFYEVEIIGPASKGGVWEPLKDDSSIIFKTLHTKNIRNITKIVDGDIIYAIKPKGTSFGYGLAIKLLSKKRLVLDIDDWEMGFFQDWRLLGKIYSFCRFWDFNNIAYTWLLEKFVKHADALSVSNYFLQKKFGGEIVPHFRDTDKFNPKNFNRFELRHEFDVEDKKVILFLGTPRKHKGILDLIDAVDLLERKDVVLMIVGASSDDQKKLPYRSYMKVSGRQPFDKIPNFLVAADLIILLQKDTPSSRGQLPAKVFDAMAMQKPIIASKVSDLPMILQNCGEIVEPGNTKELAEKINYLFNNPEYAQKLGNAARLKCIESYSYDALAPRLRSIVERVISNDRSAATK